ncbi:anthrone oxygenase family protein [Nocardia wallacei]|uniref:anthrone oxygenase family protein n=1 Tax=Nocardia wallacei TaxID=480035 RepID=UPI003CC7E19D
MSWETGWAVYTVSIALSLLTSGLFAGLSFGIAANPSLARLSPPAYVEYWQAVNRDYGRLMPAVFAVGLGSATMVLLLGLGGPPLAVTGSVVALAALLTTIVLTLAVLVPLNVQADRWAGPDFPDGWAGARDKWRRYHAIRTGVALTGFAATALVPLSQLS